MRTMRSLFYVLLGELASTRLFYPVHRPNCRCRRFAEWLKKERLCSCVLGRGEDALEVSAALAARYSKSTPGAIA
jgi:hypothetical protein